LQNKAFVRKYSEALVARAEASGLMHTAMSARNKQTLLSNGSELVSFTNCSYLGLDTDPAMIRSAQASLETWGLHYCCARSRFSTQDLFDLEEGLGGLFGGRAVTFPSVTSCHYSVLPLIASGLLLKDSNPDSKPVRMVFDRFAHASMQALIPMVSEEAIVTRIPHNDMDALVRELDAADSAGEACVYLCDGVYSMGGTAPLAQLFELMETRNLFLYIDDAHGTSIFGDRGEGYVASHLRGPWPSRLFANFSLAKGFGCNGGGIVVPSEEVEKCIRRYGQTYAFSGPLDFAMVGAALVCLEYHLSGRVKQLQKELRRKVAIIDNELFPGRTQPFSPIRMIEVGDEEMLLAVGEALIERGFFVPTVFFPVVPRGRGQLRLCVTVDHKDADLVAVAQNIKDVLAKILKQPPINTDNQILSHGSHHLPGSGEVTCP